MGLAGWRGYVCVAVIVVEGLAKPVTSLAEPSPCKKARQVLGCRAGSRVANSVVCKANGVKPVLPGGIVVNRPRNFWEYRYTKVGLVG